MQEILRTFYRGDLPFYLTTHLPFKSRNEYEILTFQKIKNGAFSTFLMLVAHKCFIDELRKCFDFELLLDIEAKKLGRVVCL